MLNAPIRSSVSISALRLHKWLLENRHGSDVSIEDGQKFFQQQVICNKGEMQPRKECRVIGFAHKCFTLTTSNPTLSANRRMVRGLLNR